MDVCEGAGFVEAGERPKTFAIYTLGCKVNQYDSEAIARELRDLGLRQVPFGEAADAYVVDTCTVTAAADRKSRKAVHKALRIDRDAVVAVTGCGPTWDAERFQGSLGIDLVAGNQRKPELASAIAEALGLEPTTARKGPDTGAPPQPRPSGAGSIKRRARAYLKVQDGCTHGCAYCIVPRVRGPETSKPLPDVVDEARKRIDEGFRELVVTGVRLGAYRDPDCRNGESLATLLEQLNELDGLSRIRISSIDPQDLSPLVIETIAQLDKVCEHVHLPLQSGDDKILTAMRRGYDVAAFRSSADALREAAPGVGLTTDVMVGFPGETEEHFGKTLNLCREVGFSRLHVFQYSPRPGTRAAEYPAQVPDVAKRERSLVLRELGKDLSQEFAEGLVGGTTEILVEQQREETREVEGLTRNYVRVRARSRPCRPGEVISVQVERAEAGELQGREVEDRSALPVPPQS